VLIDTTPSSTLVTNLKLSADSGSSDSDFVTAEAAQLLSGTLSAALQTGETVQVSLDGGSQWISAQAGSSPLSFSAPVNLGSGDSTGTIQVVVVDGAGNAGSVRSQAYRLESGPNSNGIASLSIGPDSGVVGDLLTNVSQQSLRGTLLSSLQAGERIQFRSLQSNGSWSAWGTAVGSNNSIDFTFHSTFQEGVNQLELRHLDIASNASSTFSLAPQLDSAAPTVSSITVNGAGLDRAWQAGDVATIQVNFSESIRVSGIPALTLSLTNQSKPCTYAGNSGNQLLFTYTISAADLANGNPVIAIVPGSLDLSDVAISDAAGNIALAAINNQLIGSGSADLINGTSLNDVITGAAGSDQLSGGLGFDLFVFRSGSDSCLGSNGTSYDTITDFQLGSDQLQLGIFAPVSSFENLGSATDLSASSLGILLNSTNFQAAGFGAQFSVGSATFLAVNDANPGFSAVDDLVVMASNSI
jgi:Ca2+-binding RTX toxin-like protein